MFPIARLVAAVALGAAATAVSRPAAVTYHFGVSEARTNIAFESRAELETIIGSTLTLEGTAKVDEKAGTVEVDLKVPVSSLKTGIDVRDEHLRSDLWLDAAKHPDITFKSTSSKRKEGETNVFVVTGDFTMHGVKKEIVVDAKFKKIPADVVKKTRMEDGDWVKFSTTFTAKLSDHGVKIPEGVGPKVEDAWTVKFDAFASTVAKK